jgi:hypothetical protein
MITDFIGYTEKVRKISVDITDGTNYYTVIMTIMCNNYGSRTHARCELTRKKQPEGDAVLVPRSMILNIGMMCDEYKKLETRLPLRIIIKRESCSRYNSETETEITDILYLCTLCSNLAPLELYNLERGKKTCCSIILKPRDSFLNVSENSIRLI